MSKFAFRRTRSRMLFLLIPVFSLVFLVPSSPFATNTDTRAIILELYNVVPWCKVPMARWNNLNDSDTKAFLFLSQQEKQIFQEWLQSIDDSELASVVSMADTVVVAEYATFEVESRSIPYVNFSVLQKQRNRFCYRGGIGGDIVPLGKKLLKKFEDRLKNNGKEEEVKKNA